MLRMTTRGRTARRAKDGRTAARPYRVSGEGGPGKHDSAKRSQFSGMFDGAHYVEGKGVGCPSESFCHLASFCRSGFVWGPAAACASQKRSYNAGAFGRRTIDISSMRLVVMP
jgi:hypothetical protein